MYLPKEIPLQNYKRPSTMANDPNEIGDTTLATFNSVSKFKHLGSCQTISAIPMSEKPRQNVLFNVKKFVSYNVEQQQQSQLGQSEETTYPIWQKLNTENTKATGIDSNENKINCREGNGLLAENPLPYTDFWTLFGNGKQGRRENGHSWRVQYIQGHEGRELGMYEVPYQNSSSNLEFLS